MRIVIMFLFCLVTASALSLNAVSAVDLQKSIPASNLVAVENSPNNRCGEWGCMYFEWKVRGLPGIRYVASGYEDGIDYSLYRVSDDLNYELVLRVNPVAEDPKGNHWWGYPWVTRDIAVEIVDGQRQESSSPLFASLPGVNTTL